MMTFSTNADTQRISFLPGDIVIDKLEAKIDPASESITVPAGIYYVGDPCYTAGQDDNAWQKWCNAVPDNGELLAATYNGFPVIGLHTAHGDGTYNDSDGYEYGVDAGMIGIVPVELIEKMGVQVDSSDYGRIVEFTEETQLVRHSDGVLEIGPIVIDTDPSEDERDWDADEEGEWDLDAEEEGGPLY